MCPREDYKERNIIQLSNLKQEHKVMNIGVFRFIFDFVDIIPVS